MELTETMQILEAKANPLAQKTYRQHGIKGAMFGVRYADLYALQKRIKRDHSLAQQLWKTQNHDARILATLIADPAQASETLLEEWANDLDNYALTGALADYMGQSPCACPLLEKWTNSEEEWRGQAGWSTLARVAMQENSLPNAYFEPFLETIRADIHNRKNRVRHSMNAAIIAIGLRNPELEVQAIAVAEAIGTVKVDHLGTGCKTPDAIAYIHKVKARPQKRKK